MNRMHLNTGWVKTLGLAILLLVFGTPLGLADNLTLTVNTGSVSIPLAASDYDLVSGSAVATALSGNTFGIKSTSSTWTLSMRAQAATFSFIASLGDLNPNKPCGDLAVKEGGTATWIAVSSVNQVVSTGPKQNLTALPKQMPMDYRFSSNLQTDPPGSYTITLIWTLTNP
jgi:hypothetical protein